MSHTLNESTLLWEQRVVSSNLAAPIQFPKLNQPLKPHTLPTTSRAKSFQIILISCLAFSATWEECGKNLRTNQDYIRVGKLGQELPHYRNSLLTASAREARA